MKDRKVKGNLLLKSIGFLLLPLMAFVLFSFLTYPIKPHCSLGNGISGCTPSCEPTSYFEDGRPASYKETPCFHDEPTILQLSIFNQPWLIPLVLVVLMISIFFLICKRSFKQFLKDIVYISFAPFFLLKENRRNKNLISRIFIILIAFFLIIEWLLGYYIVITTFTTSIKEAIKREQISYIERTKPKGPDVLSDEVFELTNDEKIKNERKPSAQPTEKINAEPQAKTSIDKLPVLNGGAIFGLINAYRASNGKPYWSVSDELCRLAEQRAEYLIQPTYEDFMENTYPSFKNHPGFQDIASAFNYSGLGLSENLAMGAKSDTDVINIWKNSPPHNGLMLTTDYNGANYTKACVATRVKYYGSITVLLVGDK